MNNLKATQGPYWVHDQLDEIWAGDCEDMAGNTFITEVCGDTYILGNGDRHNAHLLAASWDIYHALEEAIDKIEDLKEVYSPHTEDVLATARAALAKARGE